MLPRLLTYVARGRSWPEVGGCGALLLGQSPVHRRGEYRPSEHRMML
jgi:hypothetical protein